MIGQDKSLPDEKNISTSSEVAKLLQQLEQERRRSDFIIDHLNANIEKERKKNAEEWERFFYGPESESPEFADFVQPIRSHYEAAQSICKAIRDAERRLHATAEEKYLASGISAGTIDEGSLASHLDRGKIRELADYYFSEYTFSERGHIGNILARQLEDQIQNSATLIAKLKAQLEAERQINDIEWEQFFISASLKNTITGEPICCQEDFFRWKKQIEESNKENRTGQHSQKTEPSLPESDQKTCTPKITASSKRTTSNVPQTISPPSTPAKKHKAVVPFFCIASIVIVLLGTFLFWNVVHNSGVKSSKTYIEDQSKTVSDTRSSKTESNYIGSIKSSVIHKRSCRHAQKIIPENRIYYDTIQDAIEDGRKKCATCFVELNTASTNNYQASNNILNPISPPKNGEILYENGDERVAPFTVETKGSGYYYIKLKGSSGKDVLRFFVHGGETAEVEVPLGEYSLYYASGNTWYGSPSLFGSETLYKKATDLFDFYVDEDDGSVCGWTVELYLQANGNLGSVPISSNEF